MKKTATHTTNPEIKRLYVRIRKTASDLDKMLSKMSRLLAKEKFKGKKRRRLH